MKKRFVGRNSASLASGLVVFPGDVVDLPAKQWPDNEHILDQFIDVADAKPAPAQPKSDKE